MPYYAEVKIPVTVSNYIKAYFKAPALKRGDEILEDGAYIWKVEMDGRELSGKLSDLLEEEAYELAFLEDTEWEYFDE